MQPGVLSAQAAPHQHSSIPPGLAAAAQTHQRGAEVSCSPPEAAGRALPFAHCSFSPAVLLSLATEPSSQKFFSVDVCPDVLLAEVCMCHFSVRAGVTRQDCRAHEDWCTSECDCSAVCDLTSLVFHLLIHQAVMSPLGRSLSFNTTSK